MHAAAAERHLLLLAVDAGDAELLAGEELGREVAERRDHASARSARSGGTGTARRPRSRRARVAVAGRAALDDVGDVDLGAIEPDALEQLVEQLAGLARRRGSPACPRGSRAPRRRTSGRRSGRRPRTRPACALRRACSECSRRTPAAARRAWRDAPPDPSVSSLGAHADGSTGPKGTGSSAWH